jgi:hypothetical protein
MRFDYVKVDNFSDIEKKTFETVFGYLVGDKVGSSD